MLRFTTRNKVSAHGVGIALVSTDGFSVGNNVGTFDLSDRIPENRLSRKSNFPVSGSIEYAYDPVERVNNMLIVVPDLQSVEAVVSNKAAIRPDLTKPVPLFYKYRLGRGLKYAYQRPPVNPDTWRNLVIKIDAITNGTETVLTASEMQTYSGLMQAITLSLRGNITISTRLGRPTTVVFDIARITPVPINTLSEHYGSIFDVTIYTSERCANAQTLMVNYQGYNIDNDRIEPKVTEVLNAEPVHQFHSASYGDTAQLDVVDSTKAAPISRKQYAIKFILDE